LKLLARLLKGRVTRDEAALLLGLSDRSVRRLTARLVNGGPEALVHGNAERRSTNALDPALAAKVVAFAKFRAGRTAGLTLVTIEVPTIPVAYEGPLAGELRHRPPSFPLP